MANIYLSKKQKVLILLICILTILMFLFFPRVFVSILTNNTDLNSYAVNTNVVNNEEFVYLSDIDYIERESHVAWGQILKDVTSSGSKISVKVEGAYYTFDKGMWAHASSTLVYDLRAYSYKYFTAYVGLNATAASSSNGVKFYVYTSNDGTTWDLQTDENPQVMKAGTNAYFVKVNIENAKFLKLYANDNGANGNDHAVYADAKLTNIEEENQDIKSLEEYDNILKNYGDQDLTNPDYELTLLQRNLVKNMGQYALNRFISESSENKETFMWLFNNLENLRLYTLGGEPTGSYYNSLNVLKNLLVAHKSDFDIDEVTQYGTRLGDLYKRMVIALSLTHSARVSLWMQPNAPENQSDAVTRYEIYKMLHKEGKFVVTDTIDITKWFENYTIEEMRFVMNNIIDDEEILWLNEYTQSYVDKYPKEAWKYLTPHPYMAYVWPNYGNQIFHDPEKKDYWDEKFNGIFTKYGVTYRQGLYKLWMNFRNEYGTGAVCGGISKTGSNIRAVHGIPAAVIGQPGHAAIIYYSQDEQGNGYWNLDNDVSGWTLSEKGERMLIGWGNDSYSRGYSVVYMALAQEVLNDYDTFEQSQKYVMLAEVYNDNLIKKEEMYRKALEIQPLNIDAWYGLITTYNANTNKTGDDYYALAEELAESLKYFPLPMYHLTNLIQSKLGSVENIYKFVLLQTRILNEGRVVPNNTQDSYTVYQPSLTRLEANYLLGKIDKTIATFSFDGNDAKKLVLSNKFDGSGVRFDYSLDGKNTWHEVSFTAEEEHKLLLTDEEVASITAENDIYVHIVGVNYDEANLYKIDILDATLPTNLYGNDLENRVVGATLDMEWRYNESDDWTSYKDASPNLTGDKTIYVRVKPSGTHLASESGVFNFTEDNQTDKRKYITVSNLTIHEFSTQSTDSKRPYYAPNAIDGNLNTFWHTDYADDVRDNDVDPFITIKLDKPRYISALEFQQVVDPKRPNDPDFIKSAKIYVSEDGVNWTEAGVIEDCPQDKNLRVIDFSEGIYGEYVKIEMKTYSMFASLAMINLFEDVSNDTRPAAGIGYSTTSPTNQDVVARLVNLSSPNIVITSPGGDTHTFTENGEFTFTYYDSVTNKEGSSVARVTWIDKIAPTASIEYSTTDKTSEDVIAMLVNPSEEIEVINYSGDESENFDPFSYTFTKNGEFTFEFKDKAGNIGTAVAKVDWIYEDLNTVTPKISYSTTKPTNKEVVATISFDGHAMITNNQGLNTYTFTENGEFTFQYRDDLGHNGTATASVNNIDKIAPTAQVIYSTMTSSDKVIATLTNVSEKVTILSENGSIMHTFTENGTFEFKFQDEAGNIGTVLAKVDWITKQNNNNNNSSNNNTDVNNNNSSNNQNNNNNNQNNNTTIPGNNNENNNPNDVLNTDENNSNTNNGSNNEENNQKPNKEPSQDNNDIKVNDTNEDVINKELIVVGGVLLFSIVILIFLIRTILKRKDYK